MKRSVALAEKNRDGGEERLGNLADVHGQEEQRDEQRGDGGLGIAHNLAHGASSQQQDLGHDPTASGSPVCSWPSSRRPVACRNTSSSDGRSTEIGPTWC